MKSARTPPRFITSPSNVLYHGNIKVYDLRTEGALVEALITEGQVVYARDHSADLGIVLDYRIVTTTTDRWFEVGVPMLAAQPMESGNASAGWLWLNGFIRLHLEWSEDLVHWHVGKFADSGTPQAIVIDGQDSLIYWARSMYSVDSKVKTGHMWCEQIGGDTRNNPFTGLTLNNVVRSLPNFPYTMPTHAGQLQTDIAAIFQGATVTATSDVDWRIDVPEVNFTAYSTLNKIYWPEYHVPDYLGNLVNHDDGAIFQGEFVNASGVRCALNKQFARLGATLLKL